MNHARAAIWVKTATTMPIEPGRICCRGHEGNAMTMPWKIFACVLVVAVVAAMVMGNAAHSRHGQAAATSATGTPTGPPLDRIPPPPTNTPIQQPPSIVSAPSAGVSSHTAPSTSGASGSSSSSTASTQSAPSTVPSSFHQPSVEIAAPSEEPSSESESDVGQGSTTVETASQRVARRLRGH